MHLESNNLIHETQNGFRSSRSCVDHVFTLAETVRLNTAAPGTKVYAVFVDMRRAFDEVDRNLMLLRLNSGFLFAALSAIYERPICKVRLNDGYTDWIRSNHGTLQGDVISPQVFSVHLNLLIEKLNVCGLGIYYGSKSHEQVASLAYADDLVLLAPTPERAQGLVDILREFCTTWRMTVNVDKTQAMVFRKNTMIKREKVQLMYGDRPLKQVKQYKYLGVVFDEVLKFTAAEELLAESAGHALGSVISKTREHADICHKTYTKLCEQCVDPIVDYCSEVLGHETGKNLSDIQMRACRYYLGVPRTTTLSCLNAEMGWFPTKFRRMRSVIRYYNRIVRMDANRIPCVVFHSTVNNTTSWAWSYWKLWILVYIGLQDVRYQWTY